MTRHVKSRYYGQAPALTQMTGSHSSLHPPANHLELRPVATKGYGLFARTDLAASTLLISEEGMISITAAESLPEIFRQYESFSDERQNLFLGFHSEDQADRDERLAAKLAQRGFSNAKIPLMTKVAAIFQANAFNVQETGTDGVAETRRIMFPGVARLNHSCIANAHTYYNPTTRRMDVHAMRPIEKGEEVLISYFNILLSRDDRQVRSQDWGFSCRCPACDLSDLRQASLEETRTRARSVLEMLSRGGPWTREASRALQWIAAAAEADESLLPQIPYAAIILSKAFDFRASEVKEASEIKAFFDRAAGVQAAITGVNSPAHLSMMMLGPS